MTSRSGIAALVLIAIVASLAYYAGGVGGFGKGYAVALYQRSSDAGITVALLRRLRSGDTNWAVNVLESRLDGLLVDNSVGANSYRTLFNLPRIVGVGSDSLVDKLAAPAIAYRAEFPCSSSAKPLVDKALVQLQSRVGKSN